MLSDPDISLAFSTIEIDIRALEMTELRVMSSLQVGQNPGSVSSLLKLRWSEIHQSITRLGLRLLGSDALIADVALRLLKKVKAYRQHEMAELMTLSNTYTASYARALLAATTGARRTVPCGRLAGEFPDERAREARAHVAATGGASREMPRATSESIWASEYPASRRISRSATRWSRGRATSAISMAITPPPTVTPKRG